MKCPNCNQVLISVERNKIEFEYCDDCGGFFLDVDEWYLIKNNFNIPFEITDIMQLPAISLADAKEGAKLCPHCGERMEKINLDGLILDRCITRHGVWFDKGELSEYINKNADSTSSDTVSFLGENFIK